MKKYFLSTIIVISICSFQKNEAQVLGKNIEKFIDSLYIKNKNSIGIIVHIESPKKQLSHSYAIGYSDKNKKQKLKANQPGLIASNIKTFVSATILKLIENKKLKINQSIDELLSKNTLNLFKSDGYKLKKIKVFHLLSHTSGIGSYVDDGYIDFVNKNPNYRWTRKEQLERTIEVSDPLGKPGKIFKYGDVNYLLLTEIIEQITGKLFFEGMRETLNYKNLDLIDLWMPTLENKPITTPELIHQYWDTYGWDSKKIDISWDLYGGGGIACTAENLSKFAYQLFNYKIIQEKVVLDLIYKEVKVEKPWVHPYYMGIYEEEYSNFKGFGHGGFWGTKVIYFPKIDTSIAIYILERDQKDLQIIIINRIIDFIKKLP